MSSITLRCITGKVFVQIPWKANQNDLGFFQLIYAYSFELI